MLQFFSFFFDVKNAVMNCVFLLRNTMMILAEQLP